MDISKLNNQDLVDKFSTLVKQEKEAIAKVVLHLAEIDRRKLYLEEAYASLFEYCVKKYHYSEGGAFRRIQAARLSQKFPEVIRFLESGDATLTTLNLLSPYLTTENKSQLLASTCHKSKKEIEKILATQFPSAEIIPDKIRQLPTKHSVEFTYASVASNPHSPSAPISIGLPTGPIEIGLEGSVLSRNSQTEKPSSQDPIKGVLAAAAIKMPPKRMEIIKPVTAKRYKIELSASEELAKKIQRAKEVLRHKYPEGRLEDILGDALELLLEKRDPMLTGILKKMPVKKVITRAKSRYIPRQIKLAVYQKNHGQCSYVSPDGRHCEERGGLEVDHLHPYALGGGNALRICDCSVEITTSGARRKRLEWCRRPRSLIKNLYSRFF